MTSPLSQAVIAFDLDGTLVDTAPDLVRALNAAIAPHGLTPVPIDAVRAMVGRGARALIERAYQRAGIVADDQAIQTALAQFFEVYRNGLTVESRPFPGVEQALDQLALAGARLSVCTNKPTWLAVPLLQQLGLADRFERIVGPEDTSAKKPDPAHLITAFGGAPSGFAVLVGDSEPDVLAAKAAGALSVLFEHGYSEKPVGTLGADRLFKHFDELESLLGEAAGAAPGAGISR